MTDPDSNPAEPVKRAPTIIEFFFLLLIALLFFAGMRGCQDKFRPKCELETKPTFVAGGK
jgi:hypothetical protein